MSPLLAVVVVLLHCVVALVGCVLHATRVLPLRPAMAVSAVGLLGALGGFALFVHALVGGG